MTDTEILSLEEIWALVRRQYGKKEKGWGCVVGLTKNNLLSFLLRGPDILIEIVQDNPLTFLTEEDAHMPEPLRPVGMGVVLDEDLTKIGIPGMQTPYGLRQVSKRTFDKIMRIGWMVEEGRPDEEIAYHMNMTIREHLRQPVVGYNQLQERQPSSSGIYNLTPSHFDISPAQRELEEKLDAEVRRLQRKRTSYIS